MNVVRTAYCVAEGQDVPVVFSPGRWGQQCRDMKNNQAVSDYTRRTLLWETTLELSRRIYRPEAPSRFDIVFAFETVAAAQKFRAKSRAAHTIYEAEIRGSGSQVFRADMTALDFDGNVGLP